MKREVQTKNKYVIFIWILVGFSLIFIFFLERKKIGRRENYSAFVEGEITNKGKRAKGEKYVAYKFIVNNIEYFGTVNIRYCNTCTDDCCEKGTKVKVRYEIENPANSDLVR